MSLGRNLLAVCAVLALAAAPSVSRADLLIDFDSISATGFFADVTPGAGRGPLLTFGDVTVDGGVVMSNAGWGGMATTSPNLYGTTDAYELADGSKLPAYVTGVFDTAGAYDGITLDIINGWDAATFTLTAYDAFGDVLTNTSVDLAAYQLSGSVATVSLSGLSGLKSFKVTSSQQTGYVDFAVDTIRLKDGAVPEPGTLALFAGAGIAGLGFVVRRRR